MKIKEMKKDFVKYVEGLSDEELTAKVDWSDQSYGDNKFLDNDIYEVLDSYQSERSYENEKSNITSKQDLIDKVREKVMEDCYIDEFYYWDLRREALINKFFENEKYEDVLEENNMTRAEFLEENTLLNESIMSDLNIEGLIDSTNVHLQVEMDYDNLNQCGYKMIDDYEAIDNYLNHDGKKEEISNFMKMIITQQGYKVEDLLDEEKREASPFLSSLITEFDNMFDDQGGILATLIEISLSDYLDILSNKYENMVIPEDAVIGFFAKFCGGGSTMGIELEKDLVLPIEYCLFTPMEGKTYNYNIYDVYGIDKFSYLREKDLEKYNK